MTKLLNTLLAALVLLGGCKTSEPERIEREIEREVTVYNSSSAPSDKIASNNRRLELLAKLETLDKGKYGRYVAHQRLITYLRLFRWNDVLGNREAAANALRMAQAVNKEFGLEALEGVDLSDERSHATIRERVDKLDAGFAP